MFTRLLRSLLLVLFALPAFLMPAAAQAESAAPACHAYSGESVSVEEAAGLAWDCSNTGWQGGQPVTWLRFDLPSGAAAREFSSQITTFESVTLAAISHDGQIRSRSFGPGDARSVMAGPMFALPLPKVDAETATIIARIERPHTVTIAREARISDSPEHTHEAPMTMLIVALVAGMLLTPLLFDINFYLVLRERFVLLHAAMVVAMIGFVLFAGGLISAFVAVPISVIAIGGPLCWAVGVACAAFFMSAFLEPHALSPQMRRLTLGLGWWTLLVPGFFALQLPATQRIDNAAYFLSLAPVLVLYTLIIGTALWRGSRAARFLAAAWLPIILASGERLIRGLDAHASAANTENSLFIGMGVEVIVIALGVADRFLAVRRERDAALDKAKSMVELTERDPLTGLLNRRALELRFEQLQRDGFQTLSLIDLDRFKDINDRFGHSTGDSVLRSVAAALAQDRDALAFRMGGEEFLLLLRGRDATNRAERLRQGIATRVAADIEGLDRIVTASAGLIDISRKMLPASNLASLYDRADKLLYEAKEAGRNRMTSEKLKLFRPRAIERRRDVA